MLTLSGRAGGGRAPGRCLIGFDGATRNVSHTVGVGETVADIAAALALGVSTSLGNEFTAITSGDELILIRRTAGGFAASFDDSAAPFGDTAATSSIVTLTGTPALGEVWTVSLGGVLFSVTVDATIDTPAEIALALAAEINGDADAAGGAVRRRRRRRAAGRRQPRRRAVRNRLRDHARLGCDRRHGDRNLGGRHDRCRPRRRLERDAGDHLGRASPPRSPTPPRRAAVRRCEVAAGLAALVNGQAGFRPTSDGAQVVIVNARRDGVHGRQLRGHRRGERDDGEGHPRRRRACRAKPGRSRWTARRRSP